MKQRKHVTKLFAFMLAFVITVSYMPMNVSADSETDAAAWADVADTSWYDASKVEFTIDSAEKLAGVAALVNGTVTDAEGNTVKDTFEGDTILLTGNIDLAGKEWAPIGESNSFNGIFDGNGYGISNITITAGGTFTGLFGKTNGAVIKDFKVESGSITGTKTYVGSIVAQAQATTIKNVSNAATVTKTKEYGALGGIVGSLDKDSAIMNCSNSGAVNATSNMNSGGIVGESGTSKLENLYNTGNLISSTAYSYLYTSGIVGTFTIYKGLSMKNCYNTGIISGGKSTASGIAGSYNAITMENCFFLTDAGVVFANAGRTTDGTDAVKAADELKSEDVLTALGEAFVVDSNSVNNGYPVLKWQNEAYVRGYASSIRVKYGYAVNNIGKQSDYLITNFQHNVFDYTVEIPANISELYIGGTFRADAPEDLQVKVEYYDHKFEDNNDRDLTSCFVQGTNLFMGYVMCDDGTNTPNTFKITISIDDYEQVYTVHAIRTPVIKSVDMTDKDNVALKVEQQDEKDVYMVPADTKEVSIIADATDALITINGQEAVNGETFKLTPDYDVDGNAEVTVVAAYDDRTVTKTYTLHQDLEMASVYEEAAASKEEAKAAKEEAEAAKEEAEAAKIAAEEAKKAADAATEAAKAAKEAVEKNNTAEAEKEAAKAEAEAAKKAEEAAKAEAEAAKKAEEAAKAEAQAAKKAEEAAKAEAEAAKKEVEAAKTELTKEKFKGASIKIKSLKAAKKKVTIRWKKVKDADGYVIYRSTKKNKGYKKVKTIKKVSTVKWTNKKLKANKKYYFKIRAYKVVDGKRVYTKYSTVKQIRTK